MAKNIVKAIVVVAILAVICLLRSNKSYNCYWCHKELKGSCYSVEVYGSDQKFCSTCYTALKRSGNIVRK